MRIILWILFGVLASLAFGSSARAVGLPMAKGLPPKTATMVLADRIDQSLAKDPSGQAVIEGTECTTPRMFYDGIRAKHPSAKLSEIGDLSAYLRSLILRKAPPGTFRSARVLKVGKLCRLDMEGWSRPFNHDEGAWTDPNTAEPVLAGDCGNVLGGKVPVAVVPKVVREPCIEYRFYAKPGDTVRIAAMTNRALPAVCGPARWNGTSWDLLGSPCRDCRWLGPLTAIPSEFKPRFTFEYVVHGPVNPRTGLIEERIRLPPEMWQEYLASCIVRPDFGESDANVVRPVDWDRQFVHYAPNKWPIWNSTAGGNYYLPPGNAR